MKVVIVLPTYNEAENVKRLVPMLAEEFKSINHDILTLFVDDSSPDGTAKVLQELKQDYPFVHVLVREEKNGLGAAYMEGFKKAMEMGADVVMEMDSDLQHDPAEIKNFVKAVEGGSDYVIGSRFVKGGSIPKEWELHRKILSWGGSIFSKLVLGLFHLTDFTTGYRATRVKGILDQINLDDIISDGYAYKMDIMYKIRKLGGKIVEIPIVFGLRSEGVSKMEKQSNILDSMRVVLAIRFRESQSFIRFIAVGFAGLFSDLFLFNIIRLIILRSDYSSAISGFFAMMVTFTLNNFWSFNHHKIESFRKILMTFPIYAFFTYLTILFRSWLIGYTTGMFGDTALVANTAFMIGVAVGTVWNYLVYSRIIWRKKR